MKTLSPEMQAHLAQPVTTLARLWRATRADGQVFGFTDHDRDLVVAGVTYRAASGLAATESVAATGLAAGGHDVTGALSADTITEADLAGGLWDDAAIDVMTVNWADVTAIVHQASYRLGEVSCRDGAFSAELRGAADRLDQAQGRLYQHRCDAELGDTRCGLALAASPWQTTATVIAVGDNRRLTVSGLAAFQPGLFDRGRMVFASGLNAGRGFEVKVDVTEQGDRIIELWQPPVAAIAPGDGVTLTAGCDKRFETCRARFANGLNFRGFPHIPGTDFAVSPPLSAGVHDGRALVP